MKTKILIPVNTLLLMLLGLVLAIPVAVEAGGGHHRFGHGHYGHNYGHRYGHSHRHHKRHYKRHHRRHHYNRHNRHYGGYNQIYGPPRGYYNRPYYNRPYYNQPHYYPQPAYGYRPNFISYPPAVGYGYPRQMSLGVHTGNTRFMLRY